MSFWWKTTRRNLIFYLFFGMIQGFYYGSVLGALIEVGVI